MAFLESEHVNANRCIVHVQVGQGALCVECRADDALVRQLLHEAVHHEDTAACCTAERAFLRALEGGCQVPVPPSDGFIC